MRYSDIRLNDDFAIVSAANGDFPLISNEDALLQLLRTEACTQKGELFYDSDFGWSMFDFNHMEDSEMNRIEIENRVRENTQKHEEIESNSINIQIIFDQDTIRIIDTFQFVGSNTSYSIEINLNRVNVEVTVV